MYTYKYVDRHTSRHAQNHRDRLDTQTDRDRHRHTDTHSITPDRNLLFCMLTHMSVHRHAHSRAEEIRLKY